MEKEKDTLEAGKEEAESYLIQENEIIVQKNELYQCYKYQCEKNAVEAGERLTEAQERADVAKKTLKDKEAEMANAEKVYCDVVALEQRVDNLVST